MFNKKVIEYLTTEFFKNLIGCNVDKILFKWGQYEPIIGDHVSTFQYLLETVFFSPFVFSINPDTIELFNDRPTLKIPRNTLDNTSKKFLELMEKHHEMFFTKKISERAIPPCYRYRSFNYLSIVETCIDRRDLIIKIIYKLLMVSLEDSRQTAFYEICVFVTSVFNTIVAKQYTICLERNLNNRTQTVVEIPFKDLIAAILKTLRDVNVLRDTLLPTRNIYNTTLQ